ncbi:MULTISPECIES: peptidoglycan DD-metalloendopeptidase family protein [unclassified Arthrobacter]|uniref:peptidoglycan DD-metalloendopeptidase family protein n=1 Tax=unclassified Arthrobacter TaxID=235627 RepID=UPI003396A29A
MGNHWGSGRDDESSGPYVVAVRALAASASVAVAFFALGLPGIELVQPGAIAPAAGIGQLSNAGRDPAIMTDSRALVPFGRTIVQTVAKGGNAPLNVAAAQLRRPPEGSLMAPLEVLVPSSPFGFRISPLTGTGGDFHLGQDYAAACGTRVYSADAGVVRAAGWHPWGGGNRVEIDHGNGMITTYNHLEAIAVRTGESVQVGQVIAKVGTTGWSTGCHLHFETILNGEHTNPLRWTLLPMRQLDELQDIAMVSFAGGGPDASESQRWAIPVGADKSHTVLGGEKELPKAPNVDAALPSTAPPKTAPAGVPPSNPTTTAAATTSQTASPSPTATPTAAETASSTAAPSPTATPTASETATPTAAPSPTPTPTASQTATPTAAPSPTASETATSTAAPSQTPTPTASQTATPPPTPTATSTGTPTETSAATETQTSTPTHTPRTQTPTGSPTRTTAAAPPSPAPTAPTPAPAETSTASPTTTSAEPTRTQR